MKEKVKGSYGFITRHRFGVSVFASVFIFIFACFGLVAAGGEAVRPTDLHIVSLTVDGQEEVVPSRAATVGEFVAKNQVPVGPSDIVEPKPETPISGDNFKIRVLKAVPTTIVDNGRSITLLSPYADPREAAVKAGIELRAADDVVLEFSGEHAKNRILGRKLVVSRANLLAVTIYGKPVEYWTTSTTIGEVLEEMNIVLSEGDGITPGVNTRVVDTTFVHITRAGKKVINVEEDIAYETEYTTDSSLPIGTSQTVQEGYVGKRLIFYELSMDEGREVSRRKIQDTLVRAPVKKVVARGPGIAIPGDAKEIMVSAGIAESDHGFVQFIISKEGSWCPTKWQGQWGICPDFYEEKYPGAEKNATLGYGICQSTPAIKMAAAGNDWRTNVVTQLKWCDGYAQSRYGGWKGAYDFWISNHWW